MKNIKEFRLNVLIPNMLTFTAAAMGITALRLTVEGRFGPAVIAILIAAFLDGIDGRVARLMQGGSQFGVELDSLSDFINFGVAPAFVIYYWSLSALGSYGWMIALFFALCCELRLARFNTMLGSDETEPYWDYFFMGIPAPAGGLLCMFPVMLYFGTGSFFWTDPIVCALLVIITGSLMASRLPTLSLKKIKIPASCMLPVFLCFMLFLGLLFTKFWLTLGALGIVYLALIPVMGIYFLKLQKTYRQGQQ
jgi:CDP-diacylglycerol--serine O-phosphatidyltransferase